LNEDCLDEDDKLFFIFTESTFEGHAARTMKQIAKDGPSGNERSC
jgi:hypothetical protein